MDFRQQDVDMDALCADIRRLKEEIDLVRGEEDVRHARMIERVGWALRLLGHATTWIAPNPITPLLVAAGMKGRDTLMHHVYHGAYDRIAGVPHRLTSRGFGRGWRKCIDMPTWETPDGWIHVHNVLHHPRTNQPRDPDYLQNNMRRYDRCPGWVKPIAAVFFAMSWRAVSYGPNAARYFADKRYGNVHLVDTVALPRTYVWKTVVPALFLKFGLLPGFFLIVIGPWAAFSALANAIMTEALSNLHSMLIIAPNHSGDDLYAFTDKPSSEGERHVRQIIGTANYRTGDDVIDYAQGWLNYHIEHHIWSDLTLRQYQLIQPKVRILCEKHGIPYVQDSIWRRWRKFLEVAARRARNKVMVSEDVAKPVA